MEWRDECVREVDSFEDEEKQMCIDIAKSVTDRIKLTESAITQAENFISKI